jgi:hypothetical protein
MGQDFIMEWLRLQRLNKNDSYFSVEEIKKAMSDYGLPDGNGIHKQVNILYMWGYLDIQLIKTKAWYYYTNRKFRIKKKYVGKKCLFFDMVKDYNTKFFNNDEVVYNV